MTGEKTCDFTWVFFKQDTEKLFNFAQWNILFTQIKQIVSIKNSINHNQQKLAQRTFTDFLSNRKRKLHTFTEWNIRFPIQNMNFSVDITKNNGIVPDRHGSNTVFKSGLVAFSDFFRVNYFNILFTRFAFFVQTLFNMVMWVTKLERFLAKNQILKGNYFIL